jgi:hypothetical protein
MFNNVQIHFFCSSRTLTEHTPIHQVERQTAKRTISGLKSAMNLGVPNPLV